MTTIISNNKLSKLLFVIIKKEKFVKICYNKQFESDNNRAKKPIKGEFQHKKKEIYKIYIYHRDARNCLVSGNLTMKPRNTIFKGINLLNVLFICVVNFVHKLTIKTCLPAVFFKDSYFTAELKCFALIMVGN